MIPERLPTRVLYHCLYENGRKMTLHCAVVMPDHVHLILTLLEDEDGRSFPLEDIMKGIKSVSARAINRELGRKGSIWQDESFDHILRSDESVGAKSDYVCDNPVRRGLVKHVDDYPWLWREWIEGDKYRESGEDEDHR